MSNKKGEELSPHDPEIERTLRSIRKTKAARRLEFATNENMNPPPPPPRRTLGDFGKRTNRGKITHEFQPLNPVSFDIKNSVLTNLKENAFDGNPIRDPNEHLSKFNETCQYCCPEGITEDQKRLRLFPMSLIERAKEWLLALLSGTIATWDELEEKF